MIRFCAASDGTRLAYACSGEGPPLAMVPNYLTHLEFAWDSPVWRHWLTELSERYQLIRYDMRGCGLSDREVGELSVDAWVGDLAMVVEECGLRRFALLGMSAGAASPVAYAARNVKVV